MKKFRNFGFMALILVSVLACGFDEDDLDSEIERNHPEGPISITVASGGNKDQPTYLWSLNDDITAGFLSVARVDLPEVPVWGISSTPEDDFQSPVTHGIVPPGAIAGTLNLEHLEFDTWYRVTISKTSPGFTSSLDFCLIGNGCPANPG